MASRSEGVRRPDALRPNPLLGPAAVVDRVVWLHRRDEAQAGDPIDVLPAKVLGACGRRTIIGVLSGVW